MRIVAAVCVRSVPLVLGLCLIATAAGAELRRNDPGAAATRDGRVAFGVSEHGIDIGADLTVRTNAQQAEVHPRLRSAFALGQMLDVETQLVLPDLTMAFEPERARVNTRLRLRAPLPFVERIDSRIRRARDGTARHTAIDFASPLAILDTVQGSIARTPAGDATYGLELGFARPVGTTGHRRGVRLAGEATFAETTPASGPSRAHAGIRGVLAGSGPAGSAWATRGLGAYKLALGFEQHSTAAAAEDVAAKLELEQSWAVHPLATLDLHLKLMRTKAASVNSLEIGWQTAF